MLKCSIERSIPLFISKARKSVAGAIISLMFLKKAYRLNGSFRSPSDLLEGCKEKAATATSYLENASFILQIQGLLAETLKACPLQT